MNTSIKPKFQVLAGFSTLQALFNFVVTIIVTCMYFNVKNENHSAYISNLRTLEKLSPIDDWLGIVALVVGLVILLLTLSDFSRRHMDRSGLLFIAGGILISLVIQIIVMAKPDVLSSLTYGERGSQLIIMGLLGVASLVISIVGATKLSAYFDRMWTVRSGFFIQIVGALALFVLSIIKMPYSESGIKSVLTIFVVAQGFLVIGSIVCALSWWSVASEAGEYDEMELEDESLPQAEAIPDAPAIPASSAHVSMPAPTPPSLPYSPQPQPPYSPMPQSPYSAPASVPVSGPMAIAFPAEIDRVVDFDPTLMQLNDQQIAYIVANPAGYEPSYVSAASQLLSKRQAWQRICNYPEATLMSMLTNNVAFPVVEIDVASMALFSSNSPMLMSMLRSFAPQALSMIVENPLRFPEGVVAAAKTLV